mmetsp:Transcript_38487/g.63081  ORF Transcript_38487/g.63081 Transcript_38487/m.63081 type:complete len:410 (+) Transcript_38487:524-1753(+)
MNVLRIINAYFQQIIDAGHRLCLTLHHFVGAKRHFLTLLLGVLQHQVFTLFHHTTQLLILLQRNLFRAANKRARVFFLFRVVFVKTFVAENIRKLSRNALEIFHNQRRVKFIVVHSLLQPFKTATNLLHRHNIMLQRRRNEIDGQLNVNRFIRNVAWNIQLIDNTRLIVGIGGGHIIGGSSRFLFQVFGHIIVGHRRNQLLDDLVMKHWNVELLNRRQCFVQLARHEVLFDDHTDRALHAGNRFAAVGAPHIEQLFRVASARQQMLHMLDDRVAHISLQQVDILHKTRRQHLIDNGASNERRQQLQHIGYVLIEIFDALQQNDKAEFTIFAWNRKHRVRVLRHHITYAFGQKLRRQLAFAIAFIQRRRHDTLHDFVRIKWRIHLGCATHRFINIAAGKKLGHNLLNVFL